MIRLSDVVKEYESGTTALKGISLRIEDGEFVFLVGPSGSGKSTIIKLLTGEIVPTSGQIAVNGFSLTNIAERQIPLLRRSVGVIFQDFRLIEKKTVYENLGFAMRAVGSSPREIKKRIPYVLELVGLEEKTDRYPNELSGGEQQRVAIARALTTEPDLLIADEPVASLDVSIQAQIINLFRHLQQEHGFSILFIAHDLAMVEFLCDRVGVMYHGKLVELADTTELYEHPLHPYTKILLSAIPIPDPIAERKKVRPDYSAMKFDTEGQLVEVAPGHFVLQKGGGDVSEEK